MAGISLVPFQVIRTQLFCQDVEQGSVNTYYHQIDTAGVSADIEDFAFFMSQSIAAVMKPLIYNGATYRGVSCQVINPLPLMARDLENMGQGVGTAGAIGAPRQATGLLTFLTARAGPGYRGRLYMPFISTSDVQTDGIPTAGYITKLLAFFAIINPQFNAGAGAHAFTSTHGLWKKAGSVFTPVIGGTAQPKFATQRRRGSYGKANSSPI